MPFAFPGCFFNALDYKEIGLYNSEYKIAGDYDYILRVIRSNMKIVIVSGILTNFLRGGVTSDSIWPPFVELWKILRRNRYSFATTFAGIIGRVVLVVGGTILEVFRKLRK